MISTTTNVSNTVALVSVMETNAIARFDGELLSDKPEAYVKSNELAYYVLCNTWFLQCDAVAKGSWIPLYQYARQVGMISLIEEASNESDRVIAQLNGEPYEPGQSYLFHSLTSSLLVSDNDRIQEVLQCLRYPKRFSPSLAHKLEYKSLKEFYDFNRSLRYKQRTEPSQWIVRGMRSICADIFNDFELNIDADMGHFSNGSALHIGKLLGHKVLEYMTEFGHILDPLYPTAMPGRGRWMQYEVVYDFMPPYPKSFSSWSDAKYYSGIQAVPKSYKTARIIAQEDAARQFCMQAVRDLMYTTLQSNGYGGYLDLEDQTLSQDYARQGSISLDGYATVDLSKASDSITLSLVLSVLPNKLARIIDLVRSTHFQMPRTDYGRTCSWGPSEKVLTQMCCTSGQGITFIVESVVFLSLALFAGQTFYALTGEHVLPPRIYGDDCIIDAKIFDYFQELLLAIGCTPNSTKSYSEEYLESCGGEYFRGYDISTRYYPRKTLSGSVRRVSDEDLAAIIDLQHRLYRYSDVARFLTVLVRDFIPTMTSHLPGTDCTDLWEAAALACYDGNRLGIDKEPYEYIRKSENPKDSDFVHYAGKAVGAIPQHWGLASTAGTNQLSDLLKSKEAWERSVVLADVDMFNYMCFLREGPCYLTEVDRLLGVSERRLRKTLFTAMKPVYRLS